MLLDTLLKLLFEQNMHDILKNGFIVHDVENVTFVKDG